VRPLFCTLLLLAVACAKSDADSDAPEGERLSAAPSSPSSGLAVTASDDSLGVRRLIGRRDVDHTPGVESLGGGLIGLDDTLQFSFGHVRIAEGNALLLERMTHRDDRGSAHWVVIDAVLLPALPDSSGLVSTLCRERLRSDQRLAAIVRWSEDRWLPATIAAWRADLVEGRLVAIGTAGIDCENEGFGV
jgi:hypothetical protein